MPVWVTEVWVDWLHAFWTLLLHLIFLHGGKKNFRQFWAHLFSSFCFPFQRYGLRYTYGMFHQEIQRNEQIEFPDFWLVAGNPWEIERMDVVFPVK